MIYCHCPNLVLNFVFEELFGKGQNVISSVILPKNLKDIYLQRSEWSSSSGGLVDGGSKSDHNMYMRQTGEMDPNKV